MSSTRTSVILHARRSVQLSTNDHRMPSQILALDMPPTRRRRRLSAAITDSLTVENAYFGPGINVNPTTGEPGPANFTATTFDFVIVTPGESPNSDGQYVGFFRAVGTGTAPISFAGQGITAAQTFRFDITGNFTDINFGGTSFVTITFSAVARVCTTLTHEGASAHATMDLQYDCALFLPRPCADSRTPETRP